MKPWCRCLILVWMLLASSLAHAGVILREAGSTHSLAGQLQVFEDASRQLDIAAILLPEQQARFAPVTARVPNYGYSPSVFWARVEVQRESTDQVLWYLMLAFPTMQSIDVYTVQAGQVLQHMQGGSALPFSARPVKLPDHVFPLFLPAGVRAEVYVRISGESSKTLPLSILDADALRDTSNSRLGAIWAYVGLMIGLAFYNALLYLTVRERIFLLYWWYTLALIVVAMTLTGLASQYLWPSAGEYNLQLLLVGICVVVQLGTLFFMEFLQTRTTFRLAHLSSVFWVILLGVLMVASFWMPFHIAMSSVLVVVVLVCGIGIVLALMAIRAGNIAARHYLMSWLPLILGVIGYVSSAMGWIPVYAVTTNGIFVGSALQAVMLSLALADRMRLMKNEKDAALRQMMQQEKMASLGMLSAGVAHEINNPNNFIRVGIGNLSARVGELKSFIEESLEDDASEVRDIFREKFASIESQADIVREGTHRIDTIVKGMRAGSRADTDEMTIVNPVAGLRATVELVRPTWKTVAQFDTESLVAEARVRGSASQLNQVFTNFMINACHAIEDRQQLGAGQERGLVTLSSSLEGGQLIIRIADNGCGMSEAVQQRLFQPFFTTKTGERGTGLGMGICKKIVEEHGGRIQITSREGAGTTMSIVLPVATGG